MSKWGWIVVGGGVLFASLLTLWQSEQPRRVQAKNVFATKKIVVGTTGDYKPFTYLNRKTNEYEGFDIEVIRSFAKTTGIDVEFVPTTWPTLSADLASGKFDMVVGGVTKNIEREIIGDFTSSYLSFQKTPLVRKEDAGRLASIEQINRPDVTIGLNPGGTNEQFVRKTFTKANIVMYEQNLDIPHAVASGEVDVMITDTVEAIHYEALDQRLAAPRIQEKWIPAEKSYLVRESEGDVIDVFNLWMQSYEGQEEMEQLKEKWQVAS